MKNQLKYGLWIASFCASLAGTQAWAENLHDSVQRAISTHPAVAAAQEEAGAGRASVREERSAYFPEINTNITAGRVYGDNATSRGLSVTRGSGYSNLGEGSASVSQRVLDWGETGNKVDAAKARLEAARDVLSATREDVALRTAKAYVALLRAAELKAKAAENLAHMENYAAKIDVAVRAGGADEAQFNRANDLLLLAENAATSFNGDYQQALADFVEATGGVPKGALQRPILPSRFPLNLKAALDTAFASHPQVLAARAALVAAAHDKRAESTTLLPKVRGELSYMKRDQRDVIGGESIDARAVMKMDWAYSTGGAQHARIKRASHARAQAKAKLDEIYRRVERDVHVAWAGLDMVREQDKTQRARKNATARVVQAYKTQYEADQRSLIELMQAESQAFDASVALANADYGVMGSTYTLLAAMGGLVMALEPVNIEPVAHKDVPVVATHVVMSTPPEGAADADIEKTAHVK